MLVYLDDDRSIKLTEIDKGLWLSRIEQAPPEVSGTMDGNTIDECGQIQGSLSLLEDKVILSQALRPW